MILRKPRIQKDVEHLDFVTFTKHKLIRMIVVTDLLTGSTLKTRGKMEIGCIL